MIGNPATILFFGRPGAGKTTQAEFLADYLRTRMDRRVLSFLWSQVRDEFMQGNTQVQKRIQENHAMGKLQPKFFSVSVWGPLLLQQLTDEHLVMDGIPRQAFEAEALTSALEFFERDPILIFNMEISADAAQERMRSRAVAEGRPDDAQDESIKRRLEWFESDTLPILTSFANDPKYRIITVKADQSREDIAKELRSTVQAVFPPYARGAGAATQEPPLIMGIGMPGAGKTTILKPIADRQGLTYVSRDEIRRELFGDPLVQKDKDYVWKIAEERVRASLALGTPVVYDATFAEAEKRKAFIDSMRAMGWKRIIGLYVNTPPDIARVRNRQREHMVPDEELEEYFVKPLTKHPPALSDGFDELFTLETAGLLEFLLAQRPSSTI